MERPRYTYTPEQLLGLQDSPLIKKPDNLPRIDQWIEASVDSTQRKPRAQSGIHAAKGEENDHPTKRPSLFESRQRQGHSYSINDDVFLGPKITFASASAARQNSRKPGSEEKSTTNFNDEGADKYDRFSTRDRFRREPFTQKDRDRSGHDAEPEGYRSRQTRLNEDEEPRGKRFGEFSNDRLKDPREGGVNLESRRIGLQRGKLEASWHRSEYKPIDKSGNGERDGLETRSWRDNTDRRNDRWNNRDQRPEKDPQWMAEPAGDDMEIPSQDDFERWKEKMKAGADSKSPSADKSITDAEIYETQPQPPSEQAKIQIATNESVFGIWGNQKPEAQKVDATPSSPKANVKPKASRFAGMFKPQPAPEPPVQDVEETRSPMPSQPQRTAEDQQGFERMMQMLRMGGSSSQGLPDQAVARPPSGQFPSEAVNSRSPTLQQERTMFPLQGQTNNDPERRPDLQSRDSQFLLKLMQQPQASPNQAMAASLSQGPPDPRSRVPPGFYQEEMGFSGYQNPDNQGRPRGQPRHAPQLSTDERYANLQQRPQPQRINSGENVNNNLPPMFDRFPPPNTNQRGNVQSPSQHPGQDAIGPPPGFPPARGQSPPPFTPFPGGPPQYGNGPPPPPNMRGGPMQHPHPHQPPPGFFGGPPPPGMPGQNFPPGFGPMPPQMNNMPSHPHGQPMRSPPGMPPGQDIYGEGPRRGPGPGPGPGQPPMQSQWPPQFLKNTNGGYQ